MKNKALYCNEQLELQYRRGEKLKFLFFWGHRAAVDGQITKSCFSQWWPAPFEADGLRYPTAEHWMMAGKAALFNDSAAHERILKAGSPAAVKKMGRTVIGFNSEVWDRKKYEIVVAGNMLKFSQHPALRDFLIQTGNRILVEASPVDPVWGIGLAEDDPRAANPLLWKGENLLGYALMEVRDKISRS